MIFGNRSLVMLKEGDIATAIQDAEQSLHYFPTAKVFYIPRTTQGHTYICNSYRSTCLISSKAHSLDQLRHKICRYLCIPWLYCLLKYLCNVC